MLLTRNKPMLVQLTIAKAMIELRHIFARMIENLVGAIPVPIGEVKRFVVNETERTLLMATEEPTVVAATAHAAKLAADGFHARTSKNNSITVQAMFSDLNDEQLDRIHFDNGVATRIINSHLAEQKKGPRHLGCYSNLLQKGPAGMCTLNFVFETEEMLGAIFATREVERLKPLFVELFGVEPTAVIVTNASEFRQTNVTARWLIDQPRIGDGVAKRIIRISEWARLDESRCATHNKGVMNGIQAVMLACGQDTRAVYVPNTTPLSSFRIEDGYIVGELGISLPVATCGGGTRNPVAIAAMDHMHIESAADMAMVIASAGLAANFAALRTLADEGIPAAFDRVKEGR